MNRRYIILTVIIVAYLLILFLVFGLDTIKNEQKEATIIIDESTIWKLSKNKWNNIAYAKDKENIDNTEFTVFLNYENIGKYYLSNTDNKWYLYDQNKQAHDYEMGNFLALHANYDIKLLKFTSEQILDNTYVNQVLLENDITDTQEITVSDLVKIDFDGDGITENFYAISNAFTLEITPTKVFSIVFMEKQGQVYYLYNTIEDKKGQNGCKPYVNTIIDIDEDNIYEVVLSCGYYSMKNRLDMLYTYKDNEFKLVISNE